MTRPPAVSCEQPHTACLQLMLMSLELEVERVSPTKINVHSYCKINVYSNVQSNPYNYNM